MRKCSFCGNEVDGDAKFCPICGAEVKEEESQNETAGENATGESSGQQAYEYGQSYSNPNENVQNDANQNGGYSYGQPNGQYNGGNQFGGNQYGGGQPQKQISGTPYLIFSILVTLCCCIPLGIVSIVYASKINSLQKMGDYEGAKTAAKKAKIFMIVGAIGGLIGSVGLAATGLLGDSGSDVQTVYENIVDEKDTATTDDATKDEDKSQTKEPVAASEDLGDSWKSYTVQINDKVLTFPCAISELEAAGLTLDTDDKTEDYVINADEYELVFFEDANSNSLMFVITNRTDSAKTIKECTASGVYVDDYDVEDGNLAVIFPGDIQIGMTIDDVKAKWGEPSDSYEGDYSTTYSWSDEENYNYCTISVDPETDKITSIDLDGSDL